MGLAVAANNLAVNAVGAIALRVSLHSADPGTTGASELAGGTPAYARKVVAWNPAAASKASMVADAVFDIPAGATPTHAGYWTTGGVWLGGAPIVPPPGAYGVQGTFTLDAASMLAVAETLPTAYDLAVLAHPDLVAYLPLGSEYTDWSGNGHHATAYGTPTTGTFLDGSASTAFDGVDDFLAIASHAAMSVPDDGPGTGTGELFLGAWMSPAVSNFVDSQGTGPYAHWGGKLRDPDIVGEWDEYVFRIYDQSSYRPSRISGYAFPPEALVPGTDNLGAGSYFQDTVVPDDWIFYGLAINTNDTSTYAGGYAKVWKNGVPRDQDSLLTPYGVIPTHGSAPLRLGTATLDSFFQGRIAKFMVLSQEPTNEYVLDLYRLLVPPVTGTIELLRDLGTVEKTVTGTKLTLPVGAEGVPAGATNIVNVASAYTAGTPSVGDSKGNTYTLTRTSANSGLTMRESEFSAPVHAALEDGDAVQATLSAAVDRRVMGVEARTGIAFTTPVDKQNSGQGTSTTPGTSTFTGTTSQPDELVHAGLLVAGPDVDAFTADGVGEFIDLAAVGTNTGTNDLTLHRAGKSVDETGSFRFQPTLGTSRNWLTIVSTYRSGDATPVPPATGSGRWLGQIGSSTDTGSGTTSVITSTADTVPVGHAIAVWVHEDYTSAGPTCTDNRGNVYTRHKTLPASGNTSRMALFLAPATTAFQTGDTITVTFPSAVTRRAAVAHEFSGVLNPVVLNQSNNNSNTGTNPSTTMAATTHADAVLLGFVCVEGPVEEAVDFEPDVGNQWTHLPAVGTTGGGAAADRTVYPCYRIVATTGAYQLNPNLGTSAKYIVGATAFNAG